MIYINPIVQSNLAQRKQQSENSKRTKPKANTNGNFKEVFDEAVRELERRESDDRL